MNACPEEVGHILCARDYMYVLRLNDPNLASLVPKSIWPGTDRGKM